MSFLFSYYFIRTVNMEKENGGKNINVKKLVKTVRKSYDLMKIYSTTHFMRHIGIVK